ncbi:hypothetical protein DSO57_1006953 [Entomophthora muscae]|uniref:Uncharacterized protein n=1 Tax=Entomophthora muscae TaxID=34485 RepID=A0ACC2TI51_9FUNG|nr:hypothetical protein DSO57_1006953 [Entomophthora muscae]
MESNPLNIRGIQYAIKNKVTPEVALEWLRGGLSIYEAVEFHMASVPSKYSEAIKALGLPAEELSESFDSFRIGEIAMEWARCGVTSQTAKLWSNIGFTPQEAKPWIDQESHTKKHGHGATLGSTLH